MADVEDVIKSLKLPKIISRVGSPFSMEIPNEEGDKLLSGYQIEILTGNESGKIIELDRKELLLGRRDAAIIKSRVEGSVFFDDPSVAKTMPGWYGNLNLKSL
jgi:hypothetical protein